MDFVRYKKWNGEKCSMKKFVNSLGKHEKFLAMVLLKRSKQKEERNIKI